MRVEREDVLRCAALTRLSLRPEEIEPLRRDMEQLLSHAESLAELPLEGVAPWVHAEDAPLARREDAEGASLTQAEALANAPEAGDGLFLVPKVL